MKFVVAELIISNKKKQQINFILTYLKPIFVLIIAKLVSMIVYDSM